MNQLQFEGLIVLLSGKIASANMITTTASENLTGNEVNIKFLVLNLNYGKYLSNVWILDSGATQHICND